MKKIRIILILIVLVLIGGAAIWIVSKHKSASKEVITISEGKIVDLRPIAELCTMEIYRETAVRDTVNHKVIYGIQKQQGRITFDLSGLPAHIEASVVAGDSLSRDTIVLRLPKEKIYLAEAAEKDAWRVIDTKSLRLFGSSNMTPSEENLAKRRAINRARARLYRDGTVGRARREAAATLRRLTEDMTHRPVRVIIGYE